MKKTTILMALALVAVALLSNHGQGPAHKAVALNVPPETALQDKEKKEEPGMVTLSVTIDPSFSP